MTLQRALGRAFFLAAACGGLQAALPAYPLGMVELAPLSLVLGLATAALLARGPWTLPAALVGLVAGGLLVGSDLTTLLRDALFIGLQASVARAWMQRGGDPDWLALDQGSRLRRLVLQAAPLAALTGVLLQGLASALPGAEAVAPRFLLAAALGRWLADWAGIVVVAGIVLCWLGRPAAPWRPRRRTVAAPLILLLLAMLPGIDQVARRDESRLNARFQNSAADRLWRVQEVLGQPLQVLAAAQDALTVADASGQPLPPAVFDQLARGWTRRLPGLVAAGWLDRGNDGGPVPRHAFVPASAATLAGAATGLDTTAGNPARGANPAAAAAAGQARNAGATTTTPPSPAPTSADTRADAASAADLRRALPAWTSAELQRPLAQAWVVDKPLAAPLTADDQGRLVLMQSLRPANGALPRLVYLVVRMDRLVGPALPTLDDPNLVACLSDQPVAGAAQVRRLAGAARCLDSSLGRLTRVASQPITLAGHGLNLLVAEPATADDRLFSAVWLLALPAAAGAAMLATLLLALSGRLQRIEDRVRERTAALQLEIDDRRQAEAALAASEQRFRAIFDSVNIGVTLVDMQGRIQMANPAFCTMMSCTAAELLDQPLDEFRLPDVAEDDGTAVAMAGGEARRQRYLTHDGRVLQVAASLRTLHDSTGQPVATVGALQDLTPLLRLREAERDRDQAATASRTKSAFLARLSDELRAPLNAIVGFVQMLSGNTHGDTSAAGPEATMRRQSLERIRQSGWQLLDLVNDVLDLSRMEAGQLRLTLQPVALDELAQDAMGTLAPQALQAGVRLSLSISPQAERVQADAARLRQVLINLLTYAIQHNRPGGEVDLRARAAGVGDVLVEIHDTGPGLEDEQLARLFTPFGQPRRDRQGDRLPGRLSERPGEPTSDDLHDRLSDRFSDRLSERLHDSVDAGQPGSGSTGIGMAISLRLAHLMGGELEASSRLGEGTVLTLRLPRAAGEPRRADPSPSMALQSHVSIGSVVCIDDNLADQQRLRQLLAQRHGITLHCASSAAEGQALAVEADLVLLDLDLPDRPALDLLRELRADSRLRHLPVLVISADSHPARIDECFDAGATAYLPKPLGAAPLLQAVDQALTML